MTDEQLRISNLDMTYEVTIPVTLRTMLLGSVEYQSGFDDRCGTISVSPQVMAELLGLKQGPGRSFTDPIDVRAAVERARVARLPKAEPARLGQVLKAHNAFSEILDTLPPGSTITIQKS
jgi:hypothetical protein